METKKHFTIECKLSTQEKNLLNATIVILKTLKDTMLNEQCFTIESEDNYTVSRNDLIDMIANLQTIYEIDYLH